MNNLDLSYFISVEFIKIDGLSFTGVRVQPTDTPAALVAEGARKPTAVELERVCR